MRNLEYYFFIPFADKNISLDNKKKFGEDTIQRVSVQNTDNQFDTLLNSTITVQTNLFGTITSVATNLAIQQSRTKSVDNIIAAFKARNSRLNKYLIAGEIDKQPIYQEFFPLGVQQFTTGVTKGNVEQLMVQILAAVTAHTAEAGGSTTLAEYTAFPTNYDAARGQQLNKISAVSSGIADRQAAENAWDDQQFSNLLTFANLHRGQPQMLGIYMNQSILRADVSSATDGKGRITGIARMLADGLAVSGLKVHVVDGNINDSTTDADGSYTSQYLPTGTYTVVYSKEGLQTITLTIEVVDDGDTLHDVNMQPA